MGERGRGDLGWVGLGDSWVRSDCDCSGSCRGCWELCGRLLLLGKLEGGTFGLGLLPVRSLFLSAEGR